MIRPPEWTSTIGARNATDSNVNIFWPMKTRPISNLFRIKKASPYCLVRGGSTDLWMGHLTEGGDAVEVQNYLLARWLVFDLSVFVAGGREGPQRTRGSRKARGTISYLM